MSKKVFLSLAIIIATMVSCSKDTEETLPTTSGGGIVNTGDLRLFVLDTAKVNTVSQTGTNETTILNKKINLNSEIKDLSIKSDGTKLVYIERQGMLGQTIRTANINGTGDALIYTAAANGPGLASTDIKYVKYGATKIYFAIETRTFTPTGSNVVTKMNTINFDGTGLVSENAPLGGSDVTNDSKYIASKASVVGSTNENIMIMDRTGDNGAGSLYHMVAVPTAITFFASRPIFSYDNKFAYYCFVQSQSLKVVIINMSTKTSETKTVASGITSTSFSLNISVASDNNRGVVVIKSFENNTTPSKSYVFNFATSTSTSFNNNDAFIYDIHTW